VCEACLGGEGSESKVKCEGGERRMLQSVLVLIVEESATLRGGMEASMKRWERGGQGVCVTLP
jgi:hypothetical protein